MALTDRREREGVGGGAVEDEEDVAVGLEEFGEEFFGAGGVMIVAIAGDAVGVGGGEGGERCGAKTGGIIAREGKIGAWACHRDFGVWQGGGWCVSSEVT